MVAPHLDNHQPDCFVFWLQSCRCLAVVIVWHVLLIWQSKSLQKKDRAISQNVRSRVWELRLPLLQVLQIDGNTTEGWDGDRAAKLLRGTSGSSVMVKFARRSEQVPGVAGRPELPPKIELKQVRPCVKVSDRSS